MKESLKKAIEERRSRVNEIGQSTVRPPWLKNWSPPSYDPTKRESVQRITVTPHGVAVQNEVRKEET